MPLNPSPRALEARDPAQVELFTTTKPDKPYIEVGMIETQQATAFNTASSQEVFAKLREEAGRRGCDALIVMGSKDATVGHAGQYGGSVRTLEGYRGTCVVYRPEAAINQ
jgi:hypothetical protein